MDWWNDWFGRYEAMFGDQEWVGDLLLAGLVTLVAFLVYRLGRLIHGGAAIRIVTWLSRRLGALRFQNQEILSADEVTSLFVGTWWMLGYGVVLLGAYVYLQILFGIFPATSHLAEKLLLYLTHAVGSLVESVVAFLPNLVFLVVLLIAGRWVLRFTRLFFNGIRSQRIRVPGFYPEFAEPTYKIVRVLAIAFLLVMAFPYLPGSTSPAFQAMSLFLGVLVSLGSSGAVANFISGLVLTYMRAFHIGDRVRIADAQGDVVERSIFVTRLRTPKNVDIAIPNAMVLSNHIINFSARAAKSGVILHTTVTIGYDVPWAKVEELLLAAADQTEHFEKDPAPFVLQTALDDFYVHYELNATTREPAKMASIYSDLHRNIQDQFHAAGVEIASPHLNAVRDGNRANIPDDYLPRDYEVPSFRILPLATNPGQRR